MTIYRAEKQTDPDKMPGQIINQLTSGVTMEEHKRQYRAFRDLQSEIEEYKALEAQCCHQTVITRCEECPYAD